MASEFAHDKMLRHGLPGDKVNLEKQRFQIPDWLKS